MVWNAIPGTHTAFRFRLAKQTASVFQLLKSLTLEFLFKWIVVHLIFCPLNEPQMQPANQRAAAS